MNAASSSLESLGVFGFPGVLESHELQYVHDVELGDIGSAAIVYTRAAKDALPGVDEHILDLQSACMSLLCRC